jgi:hypothetical protein
MAFNRIIRRTAFMPFRVLQLVRLTALFTLSQLNIASINTGSTVNSQVLPNGNQIADLGTYTKTDGSVFVAASAALQPRPTPCGCSTGAANDYLWRMAA